MLTEEEFLIILDKPESSTLDFKTLMYEFDNDSNNKKIGSFLKDIICFTDTIRNETSYIIIGVEEKSDKSKIFHGIDKDIDDAILQQKVKDKVHPRPFFLYYNIRHNGLRYGVFEFPITKYAHPVVPIIKAKGLEIGQAYYRHGTSNASASALEVIRINDWMRSLQSTLPINGLNNDASNILKLLTDTNRKLSTIISEIYDTSKRFKLEDLRKFCLNELHGLNSDSSEIDIEQPKYRIQKVFFRAYRLKLIPTEAIPSQQLKMNSERLTV